jgi:NAD-reducing hydrogenase large subunit
MHFFELAGPDLLLGFDADPATRNVLGLLQADPSLALKAINLRKFGQCIIETLGGRRIHPTFAVTGGVNKTLRLAERDDLLRGLPDAIAAVQTGLTIMRGWAERNRWDIDHFAVFPTGYLGMVTPDNGLALYEGDLRLLGSAGQELERFDGADYLDYIAEHVENWSYLKFPYYKKLGWPAGVYRVGPLGRLNVATHASTPLAEAELQAFKALAAGRPVENTLYYHYARLIEALFAIERVQVLLSDPDSLSTDVLNTRQEVILDEHGLAEGVGVLEAPRGTLIHHYWADAEGKLARVNLIVATGHNNWAMSEAVDSVAKTYITGPQIREGLLNRVEAAVRAYDPCLSCSTHALGQMPMLIEVLDPAGTVVQTLRRDGGG